MTDKDFWKEVSKKEFDKFVKNYPKELDSSVFMDCVSYFDFTISKNMFDAMVAQMNFQGLTDVYRIRNNKEKK